jgi:hypothetical protein
LRELIPLATELIAKTQGDKKMLRWFIGEYWTGCSVLKSVYDYLTSVNELPKIEDLKDEEKLRLKQLMKELGTGDTENRMTQVKSLYLIEQLTNKKINL